MGEDEHKGSSVDLKETSLVPVKEYGAIYDIPVSSVLVAAKTGKLKSSQKIGRFWYVDRNEEIDLKKNKYTPKIGDPASDCLRKESPKSDIDSVASEEDTLQSKSSNGLLLRKHTEYEGISYDEDRQVYYVNFFYEGKFHFGGTYKKLEDAVAAKETIIPGSVKKKVKRKRRKEKQLDNNLRLRKHTEYEGISYSDRSKLYYANFFHNGEFHYGGAYEKLEDALAAKKRILGEG